MLSAISVKNYRSFGEMARLTLRPITILLGRNSAGKSSLTRLFPILQESMERGTSAPILWNSSSIDFGRIGDVINRQNKKEGMHISFEFAGEQLSTARGRRRTRHQANEGLADLSIFDVAFTALLYEDADGKTDYRSLKLRVDTDEIEMMVGEKFTGRAYLNGKLISKNKYWKNVLIGSKSMVPFVLFGYGPDEDNLHDLPNTTNELAQALSAFFDPADGEFGEAPTGRFSSYGEISYGTIFPFISRKNLATYISRLPGLINDPFAMPNEVSRVADLLFITYFSPIIDHVRGILSSAMEEVSYLGPIRARGDRFYRDQELSVDKIDDKGENLATYIGSLNADDLETFNAMLVQAFGVAVRSHPTGGHLSIEIGKPGDEFDNLADVGFGFSQLLPLVAQLHSGNRRRRAPRHRGGDEILITAVEQPELHLHPAYQANLADLFIAAVRNTERRGSSPLIVLETHSEALIGRLGEMIAEGKLDKEAVAVHFVEKDEETGQSSVRLGEYDDEGFIENWPVGFFSARR